MSREDVIRAVVARETGGQPLSETAVGREAPELLAAAERHFGTWETALKYAGVSSDRVRRTRWSADDVRRRLQDLCAKGRCLSRAYVAERRRPLYLAAIERFGSWTDTLRAVGIDPDRVQPYRPDERPSDADVAATLFERRRLGLSLRFVDVARDDHAFAVFVRRRFEGWQRALVAAGIVEERSGEP